jgi:hypothetical protein
MDLLDTSSVTRCRCAAPRDVIRTTAYEASFMIYDTLVPDRTYTVLSLPPIWAWALLYAGKDVENRAWPTLERGRVLIHASSETMSLRESQARRAEVSFLSGIAPSALPRVFVRRAILGSVDILDCVDDAPSKWAVPGRCHWILRDPRPLFRPVEELDGGPRFWQWTYTRTSANGGPERRAPIQSGIVPAIGAAQARRDEDAVTATHKRGF